MEIRVGREHAIDDLDIEHAVTRAWLSASRTTKALHLGPDRAGNLLEVVSVLRDDGTEVVSHAMRMRQMHESFLRDKGDADG